MSFVLSHMRCVQGYLHNRNLVFHCVALKLNEANVLLINNKASHEYNRDTRFCHDFIAL